MADVLELRRFRPAASGTKVLEPFAARLVAQGNRERFELASKANAEAKRDRAEINRLDLSLREASDELARTEAEFLRECGGRRYRKPLPGWAFAAFAAVAVCGEWALAYGLLDYFGMAGPVPTEPAGEGGFGDFAASAVRFLLNEKLWYSFFLAASLFAVAKATGTWARQRAAGRPGGLPGWAVAVANVGVAAFAWGFASIREVQLAADGAGELVGHSAAFLAVQCFGYLAAAAFAAWNADPDPEASRLAARCDRLRDERERLWKKRATLASRRTEAWAKARDEASATVHRVLGMVAAYRDHNFANRPPGCLPPDYMLSAVGEEAFEPLPLDPPPDPPAGDIRRAVGEIGRDWNTDGNRTLNVLKTS